MTAREFAHEVHHGQRYGEESYIVHLDHVAEVLRRFGVHDPDLIDAAYLHDAVEDTGWTIGAIERRFGMPVAALVEMVTNEYGGNRTERHLKTYPKIRRSREAVILKVADRIANTEHSIAQNTRHLQMYQREFAGFYAALYASGQCDAMWNHLQNITCEQRKGKERGM